MSTFGFDNRTGLYFRLTIEDNFNVFRIDVYPRRSNDDFFPAPLKVKTGLLVHHSNVPGAKPTVVSSSCLHVIAPVSGRNVFASDEDFAVIGQLHLQSGHNATYRAASEFEWMTNTDEAGGFGHTVA